MNSHRSSRGTTVFILGAGASKAAGFPLGRELMADLHMFLTEYPVGQKEALLEFWNDLVGRGVFTPEDAEMSFTRLEIAVRDTRAALKASKPPGPMGDLTLHRLLPAVITQRFLQIHREARRQGKADYLGSFVRRHVRRGDAILSFNYDCLAEIALAAEQLWGLRFGYGIDLAAFYPDLKRENDSACEVIKLHGSIGWLSSLGEVKSGFSQGLPGELEDREIFISEAVRTELGYRDIQARNPDIDRAVTTPPMTLPTYFKTVTAFPFPHLWKRAATALARADRIVSIGYSMPDADAAARSLLLSAIPAGASLDHYHRARDFQAVRALEQFFHGAGIRFREAVRRIEDLAQDDRLPLEQDGDRSEGGRGSSR